MTSFNTYQQLSHLHKNTPTHKFALIDKIQTQISITKEGNFRSNGYEIIKDACCNVVFLLLFVQVI